MDNFELFCKILGDASNSDAVLRQNAEMFLYNLEKTPENYYLLLLHTIGNDSTEIHLRHMSAVLLNTYFSKSVNGNLIFYSLNHVVQENIKNTLLDIAFKVENVTLLHNMSESIGTLACYLYPNDEWDTLIPTLIDPRNKKSKNLENTSYIILNSVIHLVKSENIYESILSYSYDSLNGSDINLMCSGLQLLCTLLITLEDPDLFHKYSYLMNDIINVIGQLMYRKEYKCINIALESLINLLESRPDALTDFYSKIVQCVSTLLISNETTEYFVQILECLSVFFENTVEFVEELELYAELSLVLLNITSVFHQDVKNICTCLEKIFHTVKKTIYKPIVNDIMIRYKRNDSDRKNMLLIIKMIPTFTEKLDTTDNYTTYIDYVFNYSKILKIDDPFHIDIIDSLKVLIHDFSPFIQGYLHEQFYNYTYLLLKYVLEIESPNQSHFRMIYHIIDTIRLFIYNSDFTNDDLPISFITEIYKVIDILLNYDQMKINASVYNLIGALEEFDNDTITIMNDLFVPKIESGIQTTLFQQYFMRNAALDCYSIFIKNHELQKLNEVITSSIQCYQKELIDKHSVLYFWSNCLTYRPENILLYFEQIYNLFMELLYSPLSDDEYRYTFRNPNNMLLEDEFNQSSFELNSSRMSLKKSALTFVYSLFRSLSLDKFQFIDMNKLNSYIFKLTEFNDTEIQALCCNIIQMVITKPYQFDIELFNYVFSLLQKPNSIEIHEDLFSCIRCLFERKYSLTANLIDSCINGLVICFRLFFRQSLLNVYSRDDRDIEIYKKFLENIYSLWEVILEKMDPNYMTLMFEIWKKESDVMLGRDIDSIFQIRLSLLIYKYYQNNYIYYFLLRFLLHDKDEVQKLCYVFLKELPPFKDRIEIRYEDISRMSPPDFLFLIYYLLINRIIERNIIDYICQYINEYSEMKQTLLIKDYFSFFATNIDPETLRSNSNRQLILLLAQRPN